MAKVDQISFTEFCSLWSNFEFRNLVRHRCLRERFVYRKIGTCMYVAARKAENYVLEIMYF